MRIFLDHLVLLNSFFKFKVLNSSLIDLVECRFEFELFEEVAGSRLGAFQLFKDTRSNPCATNQTVFL